MKRKPNARITVGRCARTGRFLTRKQAKARKASALVQVLKVRRKPNGRYA